MLTVLMSKKLFKKRKFNNSFNIIGDFDFFISLSINEIFFYIKEPLAFYREHNDNYSKKLNIYADELKKSVTLREEIFSDLLQTGQKAVMTDL